MNVENSTLVLSFGKVDHVAAGLARLPEQFKSKTMIIKLLAGLLAEFQPLEDALWQLLTQRGIDSAVGTQLDAIGVLVKQPRNGLSDADYPRYLRAKIATNRSKGTVEDLIKIANLVVDDKPNSTIWVETVGPAAVVVHIRNTLPSLATQTALLSFLQHAHKAGERLILEIELTTEALCFACATAIEGSPPMNIGNTNIQVYTTYDIMDFNPTGSLIFDEGLATQETVTYTFRGVSGGGTFFTTAPLTKNHADGCSITQFGGPGLGFGDSTEAGQPALTEAGSATAGTSGGRMVKLLE